MKHTTDSVEQLPRPNSVMWKVIHPNRETQVKVFKKFKLANKFFIPLFRFRLTSFFLFGKLFVLLETKGWKSGKTRFTPVEYIRKDKIMHIVAARGDKAHWLKNIKKNPDSFKFQTSFRRFKGDVTFLNPQENTDFLKFYIRKRAQGAKSLFGWDPKHDNLETIDLSLLAEAIIVIKISKTKN